MANRFYDNYRPPHSGQDVFGGMINNPKHPDVQGPYSGDWQDHVRNRDNGGEGFSNPPGGVSVPRKPKPSKPSGGMKLSLTGSDKAYLTGNYSKETMRG